MNYKLEIELRGSYLYVFIELYKDNYEVLREICKKIAKASKDNSVRHLLVENASPRNLSTIDAFQLAADLPSLGFNRLKVAFVDHSEANREINQFTETVAVNRGLNMKIFSEVETAKRWLLTSKKTRSVGK